MNIYQIQANGYLGAIGVVPDGTGIPYGFTRTAPTAIPNGEYARWAGTEWVPTAVPPPEPPPIVQERRISVGSFFDRFGDQKYPILASAHPLLQALIKDVSVRRYVDLARPDLLAGLNMVVVAGFPIDPDAIVNAPIQDSEQA